MPTHIATNTPGETAENTVANNGFFPNLSLNDFKKNYSVDNPIADDSARNAVVNAMIDSNRLLALWHAEQIKAGHLTLAAVPAQQYGDVSEKTMLYQRAVYFRAKADLVGQYRDYDTTARGHDRADEMEPKADDYRQQSHEALSALMDEPRAVVELI